MAWLRSRGSAEQPVPGRDRHAQVWPAHRESALSAEDLREMAKIGKLVEVTVTPGW